MKRNLVLGLCTNSAFEVIEPFIASFARHCGSAELCLFASGMDERFHREAERLGIRLEDPAPFLSPELHFLNSRFFMYRSYLKEHAGRYDNVLLTDLGDVIFQSDPFAVPRDAPVYFAAEDKIIRPDHWNSKWLAELYGEAVFEEIADNPICCVGTTIGTAAGVAAYIEYMCFSLEVRKFDGKINYDQGIHNFIAWKVRPAFIKVDLDDRIISTVIFTEPSRIRIADEMILIDDVVPPVIHQWDRKPELTAFIAQSSKFKMPRIAAADAFTEQASPILEDMTVVTHSALELVEFDRRRFFEQVHRSDVSAGELIRFYIGFHGTVFGDQREHFCTKLASLLKAQKIVQAPETLIKAQFRLDEAMLERHFPHCAGQYYEPADETAFEALDILAESDNELRDVSLPAALNHRSPRARRGRFAAFQTNQPLDLFLGPHQYQLCDTAAGRRYPACSLRDYSKDILNYDRGEISGQVVLLQDYGDGSNFAHFAFDWMTRAMHALEAGLIDGPNCTFLLGGDLGEFQKLLVNAVAELYGLDSRRFYFPKRRMLYRIADRLMFFSDQSMDNLHPAQMAHPESIRLLRKLTAKIRSEHSTTERVYISRADAKLRRVENEQEIIDISKRHGFHVARLAELPMAEQVALIRGARYIAGPHGMGMTHLMFNHGPLSVLELFHPTLGTDAYAMMARAMEFKYSALIGEDAQDGRGSYRIDPEKYEQKLREMA